MREVGYTSTKLHFANSWVRMPLKYTPLSVYVRDAFRISTWSLSGGFVFKWATRGIHCSSAGGYQTALHYCRRPLLDWGWIACFRCKASCTEPRCPYRDGSVRIHVSCHPYSKEKGKLEIASYDPFKFHFHNRDRQRSILAQGFKIFYKDRVKTGFFFDQVGYISAVYI